MYIFYTFTFYTCLYNFIHIYFPYDTQGPAIGDWVSTIKKLHFNLYTNIDNSKGSHLKFFL